MTKLYFFTFLFLVSFGKDILAQGVFEMKPVSSYKTGVFDEGAAEIAVYSPSNKTIYCTNANDNTLSVIDASDPTNLALSKAIDLSPYGGGVNSVALGNNMIAVACEAEVKQDNGSIVFFDLDGNYLNKVEVGALPDMVTFSPDNTLVVSANEGEPNDDYTVDPEGSISIIDISSGIDSPVHTHLTFENMTVDLLKGKNVRLYGPNADKPALDLEPEYVAIDEAGVFAYVVCQENNAIIKVDLTTKAISDIFGLGLKDYSLPGNGLDASDKDDAIDIKNHPIKGFYNPDGITVKTIGDKTYIFTANEGDSRDYDGYSEESRIKKIQLDSTVFPNYAELLKDENLGRFGITTAHGDTDDDGYFEELYTYGGRSFSIFTTDGQLVWDSGDQFEQITAARLPNNFNCNNDDADRDKRSDNKGPEPETIKIAEYNGELIALIGLERIGGVMAYNVNNPESPYFINYVNNRNFDVDQETAEALDLGVEDVNFISAADSPDGKDYVLTSNEVSGTVTLFEVNPKVSQNIFDEEILVSSFDTTIFTLPPSPLTTQVVFIGGHDIVQTTPTYGNPAGRAVAKEWNDFIGFTPDTTGTSLGWVSVNHEMIYRDDKIGDGGGMTAFRVKKDTAGPLEIVPQTLDDGRSGEFFNVDFVNTVGETGMNCGGINGPDGRIWTAEEWYRRSNSSIWNSSARTNSLPIRVNGLRDGYGVRDTAAFTINAPEFPLVDGETISKHDNFNYMTEIDPRQAKAVRKQYNWGRAGWEGGAMSDDGKYVYLGIDATPAPWARFVADEAYDYTKGKMQVYKQDTTVGDRWIDVPATKENVFGGLLEFSWSVGATMFVRNEWVTMDQETGIVYWTETGRDSGSSGPGRVFAAVTAESNATLANHHKALAAERGFSSATDVDYQDYYGRVLSYNPATSEVEVVINGGPYFSASPSAENYPKAHLSNPDGLSILTMDGKKFLMIQEDLNGRSFGRVPEGVSNSFCELYLLPIEARNASVNELTRVTAIPRGAEITGAIQIDDNTILVNSQHPNPNNPFPYNHSLTLAIHGFADVTIDDFNISGDAGFSFNKINREITFDQKSDYAIYNQYGKRINVQRNTSVVSTESLDAGTYLILDADQNSYKITIQ